MISTVGLKICARAVAIEKYKSITKKNRKKHDRIVLWAKNKLNNIGILISKALTES